MIKERYCSHEISKLLEEKGFDEPCRSYYINNDDNLVDACYEMILKLHEQKLL